MMGWRVVRLSGRIAFSVDEAVNRLATTTAVVVVFVFAIAVVVVVRIQGFRLQASM